MISQYHVFGLLMTVRAIPLILRQVAKDNGVENPEMLTLSQIHDEEIVAIFRKLGFKELDFPIVPSIHSLLRLSDYSGYRLDDYNEQTIKRCGADLIDALLDAIKYHQNESHLSARTADKTAPPPRVNQAS